LGFIDWHWHDELQFCVVTNGIVEFCVNDTSIILSEGRGLFINSGQLHKVMNHAGTDSTYICMDFHPDLISSFEGSIINTKYIQPFTDNSKIPYCILDHDTGWQDDILKGLKEIYQHNNERTPCHELKTFILLLEAWRNLVEFFFSSYSGQSNYQDSSRMKKIMEYINVHYMERIRLEDIAAEVNLSTSACCREFKRNMKCTIFEYIINYRIIASTKLLVTTNESITNIAYQCGFGSTSYFIEKFKGKTGVSPLTYRKGK
jgi:AraC-like DNA-binding protein